MRILFTIALVTLVLISGCTQLEGKEAAKACIEKCQSSLASGQNLTSGPCLANEIVKDWVCDVAHSPREDVDNNPENQCPSFREGLAHHFVEVDPTCNFIRAV